MKSQNSSSDSAGQQTATVDDLAMLVRRLVYEVRRSNPGSVCASKAMDYLSRCGLKSSPLRVLPPGLSK